MLAALALQSAIAKMRLVVAFIRLLFNLHVNLHGASHKTEDLQSFTSASRECGNARVSKWSAETRAHESLGLDDPLFRNQQVLREGPLLVDPLCLAAEAGGARHRKYFLRRVFVAAFGPDGFALDKLYTQFGGTNMHGLAAQGLEMHLDAASLMIDSGHMLKLREIEIGIQFAIDASQQIQVEGCGYSQFVVVGRQQLNAGFLQIGS